MSPRAITLHRDTIRRFIRAYNRGRWSRELRSAAFAAAGTIARERGWDYPRGIMDLVWVLDHTEAAAA